MEYYFSVFTLNMSLSTPTPNHEVSLINISKLFCVLSHSHIYSASHVHDPLVRFYFYTRV